MNDQKSEKKGQLIVFEGIDGTGKSTQIKALEEKLQALGHEVVRSFEPTNGPHGRRLRESATTGRLEPQEELDIFHADRLEHVETLIQPSLDRGAFVLLDRYYFSTMAYQGARGFDPQDIRRTNEAFAPQPDLLLILEVPVEIALERIGIRDGQGNDFEKSDNLARCKAIFDSISDDFCVRIDATQTPEEVSRDVAKVIEERCL